MQDILNHASFVPLPQTATEVYDGDNLNVRQAIDPFYDPVPLVKLDSKEDDQPNKDNEAAAESKSTGDLATTSVPIDQEDSHRKKRPKVSFQLP